MDFCCSVAQPAKDGSIVVRWKDKEAQLNGGNSNNNNPSGQDVGVEAASYGGAGRQQQQQQQKQSVHAPLPGLIEEAEVEYEASGRGRGMEQPRAVSSAKMNAEKKALQVGKVYRRYAEPLIG